MRLELLSIYLQDHRAGSIGGQALAKRCLKNNPDGPVGDYLRRFLVELDEEMGVLNRVIALYGQRPPLAKMAAIWLGEKVARLKLNGRLFRYSDLSRVFELEALQMMVNGKAALWEHLELVQQKDTRLSSFDFVCLRDQALAQREALWSLRRGAGRKAFVEDADTSPHDKHHGREVEA